MDKLRLPKPTYRPVGKKRTNRRTPLANQIPRPRNTFILFRCDFVDQGIIPKSIEKDHRRISEIIGHIWGGLSEEQKAPWVDMANEEKTKYWIANAAVLQASISEISDEASLTHRGIDAQPESDEMQSRRVQYGSSTRNSKLPGGSYPMRNIIMTPADYTCPKIKQIHNATSSETGHQTFGLTTLCEPADGVDYIDGVMIADSMNARDIPAASTSYPALTGDNTNENTHQDPTYSSRAQWDQLRPYLPGSWSDEEWEALLKYLMEHETQLIQAICNGQDLIAVIDDEKSTCSLLDLDQTARTTQQETFMDTSFDEVKYGMEELEHTNQIYSQFWGPGACQWNNPQDPLTGAEISGIDLYVSVMDALSILLGTSNEYSDGTRGVAPSQTLIHPPVVDPVFHGVQDQHPVTTWTNEELQYVADSLTKVGLMSLEGLWSTEGISSHFGDHSKTTALGLPSPEDYCARPCSSYDGQAQPTHAGFPDSFNENGNEHWHRETGYAPDIDPAWTVANSAISLDFFDLLDDSPINQTRFDTPHHYPFDSQLLQSWVTPDDVTPMAPNDVRRTDNNMSDFSSAMITLDHKIHSRLIAFQSEIIQLIQEEYTDLLNL